MSRNMGKSYFGVQPYDLNYLADFVRASGTKNRLKKRGFRAGVTLYDVRYGSFFRAYEAIRAFISGAA
jgi:hypothetical protein